MVAEFATIVGLLSAFSSGRTGNKQIELNEFLVWLIEHNHDDIKQAIEENHATTLSIQTILNRGLVDVHEKLDTISERLAILASRSDGIEGLALAYVQEAISDQALDILKLMEENNSKSFQLSNAASDIKQRITLFPGPNFLCDETRFFQDDLQLMVGLGLLVVSYNSNGDPLYCYTRAASKLVRSIV